MKNIKNYLVLLVIPTLVIACTQLYQKTTSFNINKSQEKVIASAEFNHSTIKIIIKENKENTLISSSLTPLQQQKLQEHVKFHPYEEWVFITNGYKNVTFYFKDSEIATAEYFDIFGEDSREYEVYKELKEML